MTRITTDASILADKSLNFVDVHHHSTVSDGNSTPELIAKVFMKKGRGVCIADHNQVKGSLYLAKLAKRKKLFTIPSIEVTSKESKDIVAYFYSANDLVSFWEKEIKNNIRNNPVWNMNKTTVSVFGLLDKIHDYNGVATVVHPLTLRPKNSSKLLKSKSFLKKVDIIESHNFGLGLYDKTMELVSKLNKPLTASSDSHRISLFNTLTASHEFETGMFLDSILKKRNVIYYKDNHHVARFLEKLVICKNNIHIKTPKN